MVRNALSVGRLIPFLLVSLGCSGNEPTTSQCVTGEIRLCVTESSCRSRQFCEAGAWAKCGGFEGICESVPEQSRASGPYPNCETCRGALRLSPVEGTVDIQSCESLDVYFADVEEPVLRCLDVCQHSSTCEPGFVCVDVSSRQAREGGARAGLCLAPCDERCSDAGWGCQLASVVGGEAAPGMTLAPLSVCLPKAI